MKRLLAVCFLVIGFQVFLTTNHWGGVLQATNLDVYEDEDAFWSKIRKTNSLELCQQYLEEYGKTGRYYEEANIKYDELYWKLCLSESNNSTNIQEQMMTFVNYLDRIEGGAFDKTAREKIDDLLWKRLNGENSRLSYVTELRKLEEKYGDFPGKHLKEVALDYNFLETKNDKEFIVEIINAAIPIKVVEYDSEQLAIDKIDESVIKGLWGNTKENTKLVIEDQLERMLTIPFENLADKLHAVVDYDRVSKTFAFSKIKGGAPPYSVELRINKNIVGKQVQIPRDVQEISLDQFNANLEGIYRLYLLDAKKQERFDLGAFELIGDSKDAPKEGSLLFPVIGFSLICLGGLLFFVRKKVSKQRNQAIQQKINERNKSKVAYATELKIEKKDEEEEEVFNEENPFFSQSGYHQIRLSEFWSASKVNSVYLANEAVSEIDSFIKTENRKSMEKEVDVPEVGGFLLGQIRKKTNEYDVTVDKFVPITTSEQNVYTVEFASNAWVELAELQEDHPEMELIGWFHTHPGHGLFLSRPDLKIQHGFFSKDHQIAMEIDPLTEHLDTAFFSWKNKGEMNNKEDKSMELGWFKWGDIMK